MLLSSCLGIAGSFSQSFGPLPRNSATRSLCTLYLLTFRCHTRHPERIGSVRQCFTGILSYRKTNKQRTSMIALSLHTVLFPFASPPLTHKGTASCKQNKDRPTPAQRPAKKVSHFIVCPLACKPVRACVCVCAQAKAT